MSGGDLSGDLDGRVAIVTGGGSGIGRAAARLLGARGASVVIGDHTADGAEETVEMIRDAGGTGDQFTTDVSNPSQCEALVARTVERFGRLDMAFNNVGVPGAMKPLWEVEPDEIAKIMAVNVHGILCGMRYQIARMKDQGLNEKGRGGSIVNNASTNGLGSTMFGHMTLYTTTKHAVVGATKATAKEAAELGVRVNAVAPGPTLTAEMKAGSSEDDRDGMAKVLPMNRLADPDEIGEAVAWLLSDAASFVTGHTLVADGGYLAS